MSTLSRAGTEEPIHVIDFLNLTDVNTRDDYGIYDMSKRIMVNILILIVSITSQPPA